MKNLLSQWQLITGKIKKHKKILLLLDYDGTLTPIVKRPEDAVLDKALRRVLVSLARKPNVAVGIISGRNLDNLKRLVGINRIYYAGNQGLQITGPGIKFIHPKARSFNSFVKRIKVVLRQGVKDIKGSIVEDKRFSLTLHYRLVKKRDVGRLVYIFKRICTPYARKGVISISSGKEFLEIIPPVNWNKGEAVKKILSKFRGESFLSFYMGDDVIDEEAFRVLRGRVGIAVFIGRPKGKTSAEYNLRSVSEVKRFLKRLKDFL